MDNKYLIENIIIRLLMDYPFYGSLVTQLHKVPTDEIVWAAVGIEDNLITLYYNPDNIKKESKRVQEGILQHECLHIILWHNYRRGDKEHFKWNIACDIAVNQKIDRDCLPQVQNNQYGLKKGESLVYYPDTFDPPLPFDLSAEEYYDLLPLSQNNISIIGKDGFGKSHKFWGDFDDVPEEYQESIVKEMVKNAMDSCKGRGDIPANLKEHVDKILKKSNVDWKKLLRLFNKSIRVSKKKRTWKKSNWKFGNTMPGYKKVYKNKIVIMVDTSASISSEDLKRWAVEIYSLYRTGAELTILDIDTRVNREYSIKKKSDFDFNFEGRGGTILQEGFNYIKDNKLSPDGVIVLTDGDGGNIEKPKNYKVLFCLTPDSNPSRLKNYAPWARYIQLSKKE